MKIKQKIYYSPEEIEGVTLTPEPTNPVTPTPTPPDPQLLARISQLEKDNAELREAYEKSKAPTPPTPFNKQNIINLFGKEFD